MIRLKRMIMFISTLLVVVVMVLLPDVAAQLLRIDAFGWQLEVKQGFFILLLLMLLWVIYFFNLLFQSVIAGSGRLRGGLRSGKLGRQERQLRDGIFKWVDAEGDLGKHAIKKSGKTLPDCLMKAFLRANEPINKLPFPQHDTEDALSNAIIARLVTNNHDSKNIDQEVKKIYLEAWLKSRPDSILAMFRLAKLMVENNDWLQAKPLLEKLEKKKVVVEQVLANSGESADLHILMASVWLAIATEDINQRKVLLRKVCRLVPAHAASILTAGLLMKSYEGSKVVKKLWLDFLQQYDDEGIADACYELLSDEPLAHFREIEHINSTPSFEWLKARLAHACQLNGLAEELLDRVILEYPRVIFLRTRASWQYEKQQWNAAYATLQCALDATTDEEER